MPVDFLPSTKDIQLTAVKSGDLDYSIFDRDDAIRLHVLHGYVGGLVKIFSATSVEL